MDFIQILVLSLVQGVTEFLPISSSAHLILVPYLTNWPDQGLAFDIAVHVGTLAAVMLYFYKDVGRLLTGMLDHLRARTNTRAAKLLRLLVLSTLPLVIVAPFLKHFVEVAARHVDVLAITSIGFGFLLYWADKYPCDTTKKTKKLRLFNWNRDCKIDLKDGHAFRKSLHDMTIRHALIFGLFQALALIPGTSRSGICMTAGRILGYSRTDASHYAMLMAMPVILMIGLFSLFSSFEGSFSWGQHSSTLFTGMGLSFVAALAGIHFLMKLVEKIGFAPFVFYRVALGAGLLFFL